jgi:multiple sugar transport system permease protein
MINTFWALIIPGLVNGFSIFLLKGFFDSLPKELYEAADIDGANEWQIFWGITMNLSKPILSIVALGAFGSAYGAFLFALILVPDPSMWTLMVWIYQLQQESGTGIIYASILLTAIPTLLVYACTQNYIMRGIVVPTDK